MDIGVVRFEVERALELLHGFRVPTLIQYRRPQPHVNRGRRARNLRGAAQRAFCRAELSQHQIRETEILKSGAVQRLGGHGLLQGRHRFARVAGHEIRNADQGQCSGIARLLRQHFLTQGTRTGGVSPLQGFLRLAEFVRG